MKAKVTTYYPDFDWLGSVMAEGDNIHNLLANAEDQFIDLPTAPRKPDVEDVFQMDGQHYLLTITEYKPISKEEAATYQRKVYDQRICRAVVVGRDG